VVIVIEPGRGSPEGLRDRLRAIATRKLRLSDLPAILAADQLRLCLTHTRTQQAEAVIDRVLRTLAPYDVWVGTSNLPEDQRHGEHLLLMVERRAMANKLHQTAS
jgi:hypothetical protein